MSGPPETDPIPLARPEIGAREEELVVDVLRSGRLSLGPMGKRFERDFAAWLGSGDAVALTVADTGTGIAAEHLPRIFDRFYRVDKSRSRAGGGSGIGLTIARHLVEAHGGQIRAESAGPGQGSTFTVRLRACSDVA